MQKMYIMRKNTCVGRNYRIDSKIGSGSFGEIFRGTNINTGLQVAIKVESVNRKNPHLLFECKVYRMLKYTRGIPELHWYGVEGNFTIMVIELLGPSLEDLFLESGRRFSLKTTLLIADQMLKRIQTVHASSIIHRDIKPHNFLIGLNGSRASRLIYIIDFGLAKLYRHTNTRTHIPYRDGKSLTGTARYVSIKTHLGVEQSRRDDLESLGYVFIYFLKGSLPWQGLKATSKKDKYDKITERKLTISIDDLCKDQPAEFVTYMKYCRNLDFTEAPDYKYLRDLFRDLAYKLGYNYDFVFDWTPTSDPIYQMMLKKNQKPKSHESNSLKAEQRDEEDQQALQTLAQFQIQPQDKNINQYDDEYQHIVLGLPQPGELAVTAAVAIVSPKTTDADLFKCDENGMYT